MNNNIHKLRKKRRLRKIKKKFFVIEAIISNNVNNAINSNKANPIENLNFHSEQPQDKINTNTKHAINKPFIPKFSVRIKQKEKDKIFEIKKSKNKKNQKNPNNFSKFLKITKVLKKSADPNNLKNPRISKMNNILESPDLKIQKRPFNIDNFSYANERTLPDINEKKECSVIDKLSMNPEYRKAFLENISFNFEFEEEELIDSTLKQKDVNFDVDIRSIDEISYNIKDLW